MKRIFRNPKVCWVAAIVTAAVLLSVASSTMWAKYVREETFSGNVHFTADLAKNMKLYEHEALRDAGTGAYTLNMANEVVANTYTLIPGLDVPKDPTVYIEEKSAIDAFLYVEVTGSLDGITYTMSSDWLLLNIAGKTVYVYKGTTAAPAIVDETFGTDGTGEIHLIAGDTFTVTDQIASKAGGQTLTFKAYLFQIETTTELTAAAAETVFKTALSIT